MTVEVEDRVTINMDPSIADFAAELLSHLREIGDYLSDLVLAQERTAKVLEAAFKVEEGDP